MKKQYVSQYQQKINNSQLESWSRYVDAKSMLRKLKSEGVDVSKYFNFLVGKHYTLSIEDFNNIKEFYDSKKIGK